MYSVRFGVANFARKTASGKLATYDTRNIRVSYPGFWGMIDCQLL
nr:MAG TPA: hypothetical protein [Bacteriophage sp.]DAP61728.1 MAG TPA: hypothetical protein [Caudoviricetes sp.]